MSRKYAGLHKFAEFKDGYQTQFQSFIKRAKNIIDVKKTTRDVAVQKRVEAIEQYLTLLEREFLMDKDDFKGIKKTFRDAMADNTPKAFLFGAGISMKPFELPSWTVLLQNAVLGTFYKDYEVTTVYEKDGVSIGLPFDDFYKKVTSRDDDNDNYFNSFDLYELGQFIEDNLQRKLNQRPNKYYEGTESTDGEMCEIVKSSLVYKVDKNCKRHDNGRYALKDDEKLNNTFIQYLCKFADVYKIDRVVTYNYDNAFEYAYGITCKTSKREPFPVFVDEQLPSANENKCIPVYHVHGFLPIFDEKYSQIDDVKKHIENNPDAKRLVLSEASYDDIAHSSYKWRNVVQIDTFLRYNCVFFGFSATDVNFKRIVKLMDWHSEQFGAQMDQPVKHFIFMTVDDFISNIFGTKIERLVDEKNDLTVMCSTNMYEKRYRNMCMQIIGYIKAILKNNEGVNIINDTDNEKLIKLSNDFFKDDDLSKVDKDKLKNNTGDLKDIAKRIAEGIDVSKADNIVIEIKQCCENIVNIVTDMLYIDDSDLSLLATRLQYLYFTLRLKRRYLKKYHIYPIWTTIEDLRYNIDAVLK